VNPSAILEHGGPPPGSETVVSELCNAPGSCNPGQGTELPATCAALPGYRFVSCLSRHPAGESWIAELPDGRTRLARIVHGFGAMNPAHEREALRRLAALAHRALLKVQIANADPGRVVLISELPGTSLRDRLAECRAERLPGIPREELLASLEALAEVLDRLHQEYSLQHLGLNPGVVLLQRGRILLMDFGLADLLWLPAGRPVALFNARYAAPELFQGHVTRSCDQYSLAMMMAELLTGLHPLRGLARIRSAMDVLRHRPDLDLLPAGDREVLGRALHREPGRRFGSCTELVSALADATPKRDPRPNGGLILASLPPVIAWPVGQASNLSAGWKPAPPAGLPLPSLSQLVPQLVASAAGPVQVQEHQRIRFLVLPGKQVQHRCAAWLPPGVALIKLESFCREWGGQVVHASDDTFVCHVYLPGSLWERCLGRQRGLEVQINLCRPDGPVVKLSEVDVLLKPLHCGKAEAGRLLWEAAPRVLGSLRAHLQACPEQRAQPRLLCDHLVRVSPAQPGVQLAMPVDCQGKDISPGGIGFFLPDQPTSAQVYLNLPADPGAAALGVLARIVRVQPCGDGWYEIGAAFPLHEPRPLR
jgi:hypothetical protein